MFQTGKFDELYEKLNPAQKEAVDAIEGPVMVIAGPGTGKTQILTLRVANRRPAGKHSCPYVYGIGVNFNAQASRRHYRERGIFG